MGQGTNNVLAEPKNNQTNFNIDDIIKVQVEVHAYQDTTEDHIVQTEPNDKECDMINMIQGIYLGRKF